MRSFEEGAFEHFVNKLKDNLGLKADKTYVENKVKTDVPANAKFTDTIVNIEVVTQAEYDNLTPVDDTFYYIKEV